MLSTEIEKRLEECLVGKDTPTRVKNLVGLHGEVLMEIMTTDPQTTFEKGVNLIKKVNYQWLYVEKILKKKYPNEDIPEDIFRQLTIALSVGGDQRLIKSLGWLYVKKSDHPVFKALRKFIEEKVNL